MRGVTAFSGIIPPSAGRQQRRLHNNATVEPMSIVAGNSE